MGKRRFTKEEIAELYGLLKNAFDPDSFSTFLFLRCGRRLRGIAANVGFEAQLLEVLDDANQGYWHYRLLDALTVDRADDPGIAAFCARFRIAVRLADPHGSLEKLVAHSRIHDMGRVRRAMAEIERRVCRVEVGDGTAFGTGFLVARDLVLTNYHVIEKLMPIGVTPDRLRFRFDFKTNGVDETVAEGTLVRPAASGALVAWKPYHANDLTDTPLSADWPADALDFALVRLAEPIGDLPAGPVAGAPAASPLPPRGWCPSAAGSPLEAGAHVIVVQHPRGAPISIAYGAVADPASNANRTRVRYEVSTTPGSSGSPCLDADWSLVALHHASDPATGEWGRFNQGIPIGAILGSLHVPSFEAVG